MDAKLRALQRERARGIEDVSDCPFYSADGTSRSPYKPYGAGMPNQRKKPKEGFNLVPCEFCILEEGKRKLQFFFPRYAVIDYNPCRLAGR